MLTPEQRAELRGRCERDLAIHWVEEDLPPTSREGLALLAEIDRLRAENAALTVANNSVRVCANHTAEIVDDGECLVCENEALREAVKAADDVIAWVSKHHPKAMREVPTPLYQELRRQSSRWREAAS